MKIIDFIKSKKTFLLYCVFGALATALEALLYYLFYKVLFKETLNVLATFISWFLTVVFAFFTNKIFVYKKKGWKGLNLFKEITSFFSCRLFSGIFNIVFMFLTVDVFKFYYMAMKLLSALCVGIMNYFGGKLWVFKERHEGKKQKEKEEFLNKSDEED